MQTVDLRLLSDEQLCERSCAGSSEAEELLVLRYTRMVRSVARPLFLVGGDGEDLIQEGMIGLTKAIRDYSGDRAASFRTYAEVCIRSRLYSAVRSALRDKHRPLNNYIPIENPLLDSETDPAAYYALCRDQGNPESLVIGQEKLRELSDSLGGLLSSFESNVLELYLEGYSYPEIAQHLNRAPKSVDNAVQRIRRKVARQLSKGVNSFD